MSDSENPEEPVVPSPVGGNASPTPAVPARKKKRRVLKTLLWLLLAVAIFHRPLFHHGVRFILIRVAAWQHLELDLHFSGDLFTNLSIENVHLVPAGNFVTPIEKISIERLHFEYSLPHLLRYGPGEFLRYYEIKKADLRFVALPPKPRDENRPRPSQVRSIAEDLNGILAQPAAYSDRVLIDDFNLHVQLPKEEVIVRGVNLSLDPDKAGQLRIAQIHIPGVPEWNNLAAVTSYEARNLFIRELTLAPEIVLEHINFDASQRAQHKGSMSLKARLFGGEATLSMAGSRLNEKGENLTRAYDTTLRVNASNVSVPGVAAYLHLPALPLSRLETFSLIFTGEPEKPRTWKSAIEARVNEWKPGAIRIEAIDAKIQIQDGHVRINAGAQAPAHVNEALLEGAIELPTTVKDFHSTSGRLALDLKFPDLGAFTATLPEPLKGTAIGTGNFSLDAGKLQAVVSVRIAALENEKLGVGSAELRLDGSTSFPPPLPDSAPVPSPRAPGEWPEILKNIQGHLTAKLDALRFGTVRTDNAALEAQMQGDLLTLKSLEIARQDNAISAEGSYRIPHDPAVEPAASPLEATFKINAPTLRAFGLMLKDEALAGHLEGDGAFHFENKMLSGEAHLDGGDFQIGKFKVPKLLLKAAVEKNDALIEAFSLQLGGTDQIAGAGKLHILQPFNYEGGAIVSIKDLAIFNPLLEVLGISEALKGNLQVDLNAKGEPPIDPAKGIENRGDLTIALTGGGYGKIDLREFKLAGIYGPGFAQSSEFKVSSGATSLTGALEFGDGKLRFKDIALVQGKIPVLSGYIFVPLDPSQPNGLVPLDEHIAANINATALDLDQLLTSVGVSAPLSGTFSASLVASGTPLEPIAHFKISGLNLRSKAVPKLDPAQLDFVLHYSKKELSVDSTLRNPQIQPLTLKGHVPLDLGALIQTKKPDPELPLDFNLKLPASSLAFVPKLAPAVRRIDGNAALDIHLGGTLGVPALSGSAAVALQSARLVNESVPPIGAFQSTLIFANKTLTFRSFRGEIGGGTFDLAGGVGLEKLTEPLFNLRLRAKDVLAMRNDAITVRVDTDLRLQGPLNSATASGEIFLTNSRFFKDIDILPIGLPGRPKAKPHSAPSRGAVSFANAPLRDWKFDIAIKTRASDPFRIRGNLANGGASVDLKFAGTGLEPYLDGTVTVDNFTASLPFSKLNVTRGFIYFRPDAPFQPSLDLQAESNVRDYRVDAYISGTALDPQVSLSSEPPLSQADIVSLLATGTTASELTGNSNVLAGRAAMLVLQQLYHKVFKTRDSNDQQSLAQRFEIDMGAIDSRTGRQELSARFKVADQLYLIGDVDVTGQFTGRLRYLLRFK